MIRSEIICDYCGLTVDGVKDDSHFNLPDKWCVLGFHSQGFVAPDDWRVTHHFCSLDCLNKAVKVEKGVMHPDNEEES